MKLFTKAKPWAIVCRALLQKDTSKPLNKVVVSLILWYGCQKHLHLGLILSLSGSQKSGRVAIIFILFGVIGFCGSAGEEGVDSFFWALNLTTELICSPLNDLIFIDQTLA